MYLRGDQTQDFAEGTPPKVTWILRRGETLSLGARYYRTQWN